MIGTKPTIPVMLRPAGSDCQLSCGDCYTHSGPAVDRPTMSIEVVEAIMGQIKEHSLEHAIGYQGGEPLLAGIDWFREVVQVQGRLGMDPVSYVQTNGLLLDYDFLNLFSLGGWSVGISYNGTMSYIRKPLSREYTAQIGDWIKRARGREIPVMILCVVDGASVEMPLRVLDELCALDPDCVSFLPARRSTYSPTPEKYAEFLQTAMGLVPPEFIGNYSNAWSQWRGARSDCQLAPWCFTGAVCDWNGDLYACDWYMEPQHCLGNVLKGQNIADDVFMGLSVTKRRRASSVILPKCLGCPAEKGCYGGCPVTVNGLRHQTYCEAYKVVSLEAKP